MTIARHLAERIHAFQAWDMSPLALKGSIARSSMRSAAARLAWRRTRHTFRCASQIVAEAPCPATIWDANRRTSLLDAAPVHGTASCALDYDDVAGVMGRYPSTTLIPTAIALGESLGSSGRDLALAYAVGYTTECHIVGGVRFYRYDKGRHPTATQSLSLLPTRRQ